MPKFTVTLDVAETYGFRVEVEARTKKQAEAKAHAIHSGAAVAGPGQDRGEKYGDQVIVETADIEEVK